MAYNNGFPATYQPMYQPMYQPNNFQNGNTQMMTPPTIRAEIVQVDGEQAAANYPVGPGASQMMIAKDDSAIFVKSILPNGQPMLDVFEKRARTAPAESFDPNKYVTREELEKRLEGLVAAQKGAEG